MQSRTRYRHMIDFIFPVVLFLVFALSALTVTLLAARIYQSGTEHSARNDSARTSLSYVIEKVHQNDAEGVVSTGSFDGCDALILQQTYNDEIYDTYIYAYDGMLKELFMKEGANATASDGKDILAVEEFTITELDDGLFRFHCVDADGQKAESIVSLQSSADASDVSL